MGSMLGFLIFRETISSLFDAVSSVGSLLVTQFLVWVLFLTSDEMQVPASIGPERPGSPKTKGLLRV